MSDQAPPPEEAQRGFALGLPYTPNHQTTLLTAVLTSGRAEFKGIDQGLTTSPKAWPEPFLEACWVLHGGTGVGGGLTDGAPGLLILLALSQALGVRAQTGFS